MNIICKQPGALFGSRAFIVSKCKVCLKRDGKIWFILNSEIMKERGAMNEYNIYDAVN